jgi:hypothetical protein
MRASHACGLSLVLVGLAASPCLATALPDLTFTALSGAPASLGVGESF